MLASLLTVPIYGLITIIIHADEQLCKLAHFCHLKDLCNCFAIWTRGYSLTHKSCVGLTSVHICKCYFRMNKGYRIKFIPGRRKGTEITRNVIQIGNLYSSERFPGFIMFHDSLWWALFLFKQTNHPLKHWLFHSWMEVTRHWNSFQRLQPSWAWRDICLVSLIAGRNTSQRVSKVSWWAPINFLRE